MNTIKNEDDKIIKYQHAQSKVQEYCNFMNIAILDGSQNHYKPIDLKELPEDFQLIEKYPDCPKLINAAGKKAKLFKHFCKYGSTVIRVAKLKSGELRLYVNSDSGFLTFDHMLAIYVFTEGENNHIERLLVNTMKVIGLACNVVSDEGDYTSRASINSRHLRVLYAEPIECEKFDMVMNVNRTYDKHNQVEHICNVIFLELSGRVAHSCFKCAKSGPDKHSHIGAVSFYRDYNKIDLRDHTSVDLKTYFNVLEVMANMHSTTKIEKAMEYYKDVIKRWSKYAQNNYLGRNISIRSLKPFFTINCHNEWFQRKDNKSIFESECFIKDKINKCKVNVYYCIIRRCTYSVGKLDDMMKHVKSNHYVLVNNKGISKKELALIVMSKSSNL